MAKGKKTTVNDWWPRIEEWKSSQLSKKEFCIRENLNYKDFTKWYSRLMSPSKKIITKKSNLFIPVKIKSAELLNQSTLMKPLVLVLNRQAQLHIPMEHVNAQFLTVLFQSLGVISC